jgi:hypothetical protein
VLETSRPKAEGLDAAVNKELTEELESLEDEVLETPRPIAEGLDDELDDELDDDIIETVFSEELET